jgi:uncharacterized protein (TIGR03790 family)
MWTLSVFRRVGVGVAVAWALVMAAGTARAALRADELVLVVNSKSMEGVLLANHYATVRGVPRSNVLVLELPTDEQMTFDDYERKVVPAVRQFFRVHKQVAAKAKCLVTFYGVPIRIQARQPSAELTREQNLLQQELTEALAKVEPIVVAQEKLAKELDPTFEAKAGKGVDELAQRVDAAGRVVGRVAAVEADPDKRQALMRRQVQVYAGLLGMGAMIEKLSAQGEVHFQEGAGPATRQVMDGYEQAKKAIPQLKEMRYEARAREQLRATVKANLGPLDYARVVQAQAEYLKTPEPKFEGTAAFDNELALVMWDFYPRARWQLNPLHYRVPAAAVLPAPVYMVMRIDAGTVKAARALIDASIKAEEEGLKGTAVVDAKGVGDHQNAYNAFDVRLGALAQLIREKSTLELFYDHQVEVITRPPEDRVRSVALYCGWYTANYVRSFNFVPGAVGYHVQSFTMSTLHNNVMGMWTSGMLQDGAAATLGPVDEPYLTSFPDPVDFFGLLMTGKLTLAEVYWKTTPMTSWMITMIGDPLYTPFKNSPALKVEDLPAALQGAITGQAVVAGGPVPDGEAPSPATTQAAAGAGR